MNAASRANEQYSSTHEKHGKPRLPGTLNTRTPHSHLCKFLLMSWADNSLWTLRVVPDPRYARMARRYPRDAAALGDRRQATVPRRRGRGGVYQRRWSSAQEALHRDLMLDLGVSSVVARADFRLYIMSLFAERWLRHIDRLPTDLRKREKIFDWVAIFFCIVGSAGLILCSIVSHPSKHS